MKSRAERQTESVLNVVGYISDTELLGLFQKSYDGYFWHINKAIATRKFKATPHKIRITVSMSHHKETLKNIEELRE